MKKARILLYALLILSLVIISVGCGKSGVSETKNSGASTETTGNAAPEVKKLANPDLTVMHIMSTGVNDAEGPGAETKKWYEETYGGKVTEKIIGWAEIETKLLVMTSAGSGPDLVVNSDLYIPRLIVKNIYQPMDDYIDLSDPIFKLDAMDLLKWKGKHYIACWNGSMAPWVMLYNADIFENSGIKTPTEYYKEGTWTFENLRKVSMELTQDSDKDGNIDQWGCEYYAFDMFPLQNGGSFLKFNDDETISITWNNPGTLEGYQFFQDALKEKWLYGTPTYNADFLSGKAAMFIEALPMDYINMGYPGGGTVKFKMDFAPCPVGPRAEKNTITTTALGWGIGTGCANPEGAGLFVTQWYKNLKNWAEGKEKPQSAPEANGNYLFSQEQKDFYMEVLGASKAIIPLISGIPADWDSWNFTMDLSKGVPPATVLEKYTAPLQATIDKLVKETPPTIEAYNAPAPEDFESGTMGIFTTSDAVPVKADVTKDAAEIIGGTASLKIEAPDAGGFVVRTDETKLKLPPLHIYKISFDYKVIKAPAEGGNFSVWIFPKVNLIDRAMYYAGMWVNTMPPLKDGDTGNYSVDLTITNETQDNVVVLQNAGGGTIVIDNFTVVEAE